MNLPRNSCPTCGKLLFIGFADNIEIKCRRCGKICVFTKEDWTNKKNEAQRDPELNGGKI